MALQKRRSWPTAKQHREDVEARRPRELFRCSVCERGFHGRLVVETTPPEGAPVGRCPACQEDRLQ